MRTRAKSVENFHLSPLKQIGPMAATKLDKISTLLYGLHYFPGTKEKSQLQPYCCYNTYIAHPASRLELYQKLAVSSKVPTLTFPLTDVHSPRESKALFRHLQYMLSYCLQLKHMYSRTWTKGMVHNFILFGRFGYKIGLIFRKTLWQNCGEHDHTSTV